MKNVLRTSILSLAALMLVFSCSQENDIAPKTEFPELTAIKLIDNESFLHLINSLERSKKAFYNRIQLIPSNKREAYVDNIQSFSEAADINDLEAISSIMGYDSKDEYLARRNEIFESWQQLLKEFPQLEDAKLATEVFTEANKMLSERSQNNIALRLSNNCYAQYSNCEAEADATLAVATSACVGSVFIPIAGPFIGVGCEIAALRLHYVQSEGCDLDYDDCINE